MNESFSSITGSNPFSTRFTAPGQAPFFFETNLLAWIKSSHPAKFDEFFTSSVGSGEELRFSVCLRYLVDKFETHSCRGQIVGAHGSGKSSLLYVLKEALIKQGYELFSWSQHDQSKFLPDVFWMELQRFLQTAPVLLPTKFLLPPPVMSHEEYISQQRDYLRGVFAGKSSESTLKTQTSNVETEEEFRVSDSTEISTESDELTSVPESSVSPAAVVPETVSKPAPLKGVFGFNAAGNFGLKSANIPDGDGVVFKKTESPIKFAPFPGLPETDENAVSSQEEYDDVELAAVDESALSDVPDVAQETLELPENFGVDKRRSFFDRKILVFDGFEQLSFANRIIVRTFCRMNHLGLLLTTHTPMIGVPVLFRTIPSVDTIHQLLEYLLEDFVEFKISDSEVETLLKNFHYDVREMLFSLYDAYENYRLAPQNLREKIVRRYPR